MNKYKSIVSREVKWEIGSLNNGGWTAYKTRKARTKFFNKYYTMKDEIQKETRCIAEIH